MERMLKSNTFSEGFIDYVKASWYFKYEELFPTIKPIKGLTLPGYVPFVRNSF